MKNFGKRALCLLVCLFVMGFAAQSALAEHGWSEDPPQNGKPEDPVNPAVGPTYYGQPLTLDGRPWTDDPPKNGRPEFEASPTAGPLAWWMQPVVDEKPWEEKPPKPGKPKPE